MRLVDRYVSPLLSRLLGQRDPKSRDRAELDAALQELGTALDDRRRVVEWDPQGYRCRSYGAVKDSRAWMRFRWMGSAAHGREVRALFGVKGDDT